MTDQNEFNQDEEKEKIIEVVIWQVRPRKVLTVLKGVPDNEKEDILKKLKKSVGCGGNIDEKTGNLQLQGDYSYKIQEEINKVLCGYMVDLRNSSSAAKK